MIPTTVRMEIVGTMVSVIAGGPSKKTSSATSAAAGLAAVAFFTSPPLRLPRLAYIVLQRLRICELVAYLLIIVLYLFGEFDSI
jgi:hypothetical protein